MKYAFSGVALFLVLMFALIFWPFVVVSPGEVGVLALFGQVSAQPLDPGFHGINPMAHVYRVNVQMQKAEVKGEAASSDMQTVDTKLAVNYRLAAKSVPALYSDIGLDYEVKIIDPIVQDRFKSVTAQYTAEHLITKREEVRQKIRELVSSATSERSNGAIMVQDVLLTDFQFGIAFNHAIEAKQVAEQNALTEKNNLAKMQYLAEQRVATAKGEAEAIRIQAQSISAQGGEAYVKLKAVEKWNGELPTYMVPGSSVPFLQLSK